MAGKVRIRQITPAEMTAVRQRFRSDTRKRRFHVVAIAARHFVRAEALIQDYGEAYGLRALDALQLSVALDLHAHHLIEDFVVADRVLCQVAPMAGLAIINPELTKH